MNNNIGYQMFFYTSSPSVLTLRLDMKLTQNLRRPSLDDIDYIKCIFYTTLKFRIFSLIIQPRKTFKS